MSENNLIQPTDRRSFLGSLATGAAALGLSAFASPSKLEAAANELDPDLADPDAWFNQIKGKHRIVFDVPQPNEVYPFAWSRIFLVTNSKTGTPESDCSVVVVIRHTAIGYTMANPLWEKYNFGEFFKVENQDKTPATKNPFWQTEPFNVPGVGPVPIAINDLQKSGVLFCVCDMALTVYSAVAAGKMNMKPEDVKKEWVAGLLPGIQVVPSGVWALGRAQEKGCGYIFTG